MMFFPGKTLWQKNSALYGQNLLKCCANPVHSPDP